MKLIARVLTGGSFLISGIMLMCSIFPILDWKRVAQFGLMHELNLNGSALTFFLIGLTLSILGVITMLYHCLFVKEVD